MDTTENIEATITNKQKELELRKLELEESKQQFIKASAVFVAQWYNETAKRYVCTDPQNTLRLGRNELSHMKIKLKDLSDNAVGIANEFLSERSLWWHLAPKDEDNHSFSYEKYGNKCPDIIDKPIRKVLGKLGVLLEEYGYDVTTKGAGSSDIVSVWNNKNVSPYPINPVPYYPDSFDWSKDMQNMMRRYNEIYKQACDTYSDIKRLQQSKLAKQAADLWNST